MILNSKKCVTHGIRLPVNNDAPCELYSYILRNTIATILRINIIILTDVLFNTGAKMCWNNYFLRFLFISKWIYASKAQLAWHNKLAATIVS